MAQRKVVMKISALNQQNMQKAMAAVSTITGIRTIDVDLNEQKMTIIGKMDMDVGAINRELMKVWKVEILSVDPVEEEKDVKGKGKATAKDVKGKDKATAKDLKGKAKGKV